MDYTKTHNIISVLAQLPSCKEHKIKYVEQLKKNTEKAIELLPPSEDITEVIKKSSKVTTKFVLISLHILKVLSKLSNEDLPSNLMSVQQQQKVKILLQLILSLGLTPALFDGVNTSLKNKTSQLYLLDLEEFALSESYLLMCDIIKSLLEILPAPNLRPLILIHLGDLIAALLQVIHKGKFKKPVKNISEDDTDKLHVTSQFIMTEGWYQQLIRDRNEFKNIYKELVDNIHKPLVIKELLILLAPIKSTETNKIISPPNWLKKAISYQLTEYLTSPGGVFVIIRAMCETSSDTIDWKKVEGIARLISTTHKNFTDDAFYAIVSPQIISLLNAEGPYCIPVAKSCIKNIYYYNVDICNKYVFEKLFEPFRLCARPVSKSFSGILVSEDSLSQCIDHLSKCFGSGSENFSIPLMVLKEIIKILYLLYMKVSKSLYQHKTAIQNLLIEFLYSVKDIKNLTTIYNALIFNESHKDFLEMNRNLEFQFGPSAGVQVGRCANSTNTCSRFTESEFEFEFEIAGDHMLDLLSERQEYSKKLLTDLFVILLSALHDFHENKFDTPNSSADLLGVDELIIFLVNTSQRRIITIKLLAVLAENVQVIKAIQENPDIVFKFVYDLLNLKARELVKDKKLNFEKDDLTYNGENSNEDPKSDSAEDIFVALAVVDLITVNIKSNSDRWEMCNSLVGTLKMIRDHTEDNNIKYFSDVLFSRITTRGVACAVKTSLNESFCNQKLFNLTSKKGKKKVNSDELHQLFKNQKQRKDKNLANEINKNEKQKDEIDILFEEICSADIPTRGHSIIQIQKLIKQEDIRILSKKDYVFSVLKCNLKHEDTYVYLSAINAMETLANVQKADKILEVLCEEYTEHKKEFSEIQMKIGEVLMRIIRGLGEVAPKYKSLLVNTFLFGTKSFDELLRASSLSNLGELLKILGYSVGNILQEVFVCIKATAMTDKSEMVRRAAVMVAVFLLRGISENSFIVLTSVIRDLYKALLQIYKTEKDEVTRLHADLALAEIDRLVRTSMNKNLNLEKRIGILNLREQ